MGSVWWRDLKNMCQLENNEGWVLANMKKEVASGNEIKLWTNKWSGDVILKENYHRLFCNSCQQDEFLENMGVWRDGVWCQRFRWRDPGLNGDVTTNEYFVGTRALTIGFL